MKKKLHFLLIEDDENDAALLLRELKNAEYEPVYRRVTNAQELREALAAGMWDIVISDFTLPGFSGAEASRIVKSTYPFMPFILVSGTVGEETAVEALKAGADDFLLKDKLIRLIPAIERELHARQERERMEHELKLKEAQLLQSQKLESIGRLAGGIAHDFNNKLTIITLAAHSLLEKRPNAQEFEKGMGHVLKAAEKAANLTRQLLAFSRKQVLLPEVVQIDEKIIEFKSMLDRIVGDDIKIGFTKGVVAPIKIDPGQFDQILLNLVVNARDAMPKGGKIDITAENCVVDEAWVRRHPYMQTGKYVRLSVRDNGVGMNEETKQNIFEPFFTTKGKERGSGLGLSTVYGIVQQSGGAIVVESEEGKGAEFFIYFPATEEKASSPKTVVGSREKIETRLRVLVVEDEPLLRDLVQSVLEEEGHLVRVFEDPAAALDACRSKGEEYDILLTDMMLAGLTGIELIREMRQIDPGIKCIVMSGFAERDVFVDDLGFGSSIPFLQKPFSNQTLLNAIEKII